MDREQTGESLRSRSRGSRKSRRKPKKQGSFSWLLVIILLVILGVQFRSKSAGSLSSSGEFAFESNAMIGGVGGVSYEERQEQLNEIAEKGMITVSINSTPYVSLSNPEGKVNWLIENPADQNKLIRVEVFLGETNELIYHTDALRPGTYIEAGELEKDLGEGVYPCTAYFYSYEIDSQKYIGKAGADIKLTVTP